MSRFPFTDIILSGNACCISRALNSKDEHIQVAFSEKFQERKTENIFDLWALMK